MLKFLLRLVLCALFLGGCGDLATEPQVLEPGQSLGSDCGMYNDAYLLCPINPVVPPAECDPWTDGSWCKGDVCVTSAQRPDISEATVANCPVGGNLPPPVPARPGTGGGEAPTEMPQDTCRIGDAIIDSPEVHGGFAKLWRMSTTEGVEKAAGSCATQAGAIA